MAQHKYSPDGWQGAGTAQIVSFDEAKAARLDRRLAASEHAATQALAGCRAGRTPLNELMRTLIAPFNSDPC